MGGNGETPLGPLTPLQRSLGPSCLTTLLAVLVIVLLLRVRLPPLPYGLLVVGGIWLLCFIGVFLWQVHGRRREE
jgi:hypothetical protein